jgi:alpha-tubulin suppressor-like RCC1 family protein
LGIVVISLVLGALSCEAPTSVVGGGAQLSWVSAPPTTLREGDSATVIVELRDTRGQPLLALDGAPASLRFAFAQDSQPGTACGTACTTTVAQGRAQITVAWVSAGNWTAIACVRPAVPADSACVQAPLTVLPVGAALVTFPRDSIGRRVRFPVEARLRLPDGTPVTDLAGTVRLRFTSAAPAAGHVQCPGSGPVCERAPVAGVVRLDSVLVLDTAATTLEACAVAPNGHERCDPAGPRTFRVVVPRPTLHFVAEPGGGSAGVPFATQPVIEALEPDGTRRADFAGLVDLALGMGGQLGPVLAGTDSGGATARGTVTVRAAAGAATLTDLRVNQAGAGYTLVAAAAGAVADTSAAFNVPLDTAQLRIAKTAGENQYALPGSSLHIAPTVRVTGPRSDPIAGIVVHFAVTAGGGAIVATSDTTDVTGIATSGAWLLGSLLGAQTLAATAAGVAPLTFAAEGIAPTQLAFVVQPTDVVAGDTIRPAVVVELQDDRGRRVFGATDSVLMRGGLLGNHDREAVDGRATFDALSLFMAAEHTLQALSKLGGSSYQYVVSASFRVSPGAPARLVAEAGDNQIAHPGTTVDAPTARVEDAQHNEIPGRTVTFAVTAGGGTVANPVQTTDSSGRARPGAWTLGPSPGVNVLSATTAGMDTTVTFTAMADTSRRVPTGLAFVVQPPYGFGAGDTIRPAVVVELQDEQGRRVFGATDSVSLTAYECQFDGLSCFQVNDTPRQLLGTTTRAAVDGRAIFDDLTITELGRRLLKASITGGPTSGASSDFVVGAGAPVALVIVEGNSQSATVGTAVTTPPSVRLVDYYGNGSYGAGVTVTFAVTMGGGSVTDPVQFVENGLYRPTAWTLGPQPGVNMLTATAQGLAPVTFFATGTPPPFNAVSVSAGWDFTCAAAQTTNLPYCWGANTYSQLGEGTQTARSRPTQLAGGLLQLTQVSGGSGFACGLATTGAAYCWGNNWYGQLGIDTADVNQHATPEAVVGGHTFQQIAAGFGHVCALDTDGAVWCWGAQSEGSLGVGVDRTGNTHPLHVASLLRFTQIDVGGNTSCALAESGDIWCWGYNGYGGVGNNSTDARLWVPVQVDGGRSYTQVSVGTFHTCGISLGAVYCWGRNVEAQLGIGTTSPTSSPGSAVPVPALGALGLTRQVAAGNTHTCAVNATGETYCWGSNANGQLGDLTTTLRTSGVLVRTDARFVAITAGLVHTCASTEAGATYCWGSNGSGRIGDGTVLQRTAPVLVAVP